MDRKYKSEAVKVLEDGKTIRLTDAVYVSKLEVTFLSVSALTTRCIVV